MRAETGRRIQRDEQEGGVDRPRARRPASPAQLRRAAQYYIIIIIIIIIIINTIVFIVASVAGVAGSVAPRGDAELSGDAAGRCTRVRAGPSSGPGPRSGRLDRSA